MLTKPDKIIVRSTFNLESIDVAAKNAFENGISFETRAVAVYITDTKSDTNDATISLLSHIAS
jgi:hypothetical protein